MSQRFIVKFYVDVPDGHTFRGEPETKETIAEWAGACGESWAKGGPLKCVLDSVTEYVEKKPVARTVRGRKVVA